MTANNAAYAAILQRKLNSPISALPETGFARLPVVTQVVGVAGSTIWLWVRKGKFPRPVKISERVTGWRVEEVRAFLADPHGWRNVNVEG